MFKNWGGRLIRAIKCGFSVLVSIILLYPIMGLISPIFYKLHQLSGADFLSVIGNFLNHPLILPIHRGGMTIDIAPLLVVAAAGIWGWTRQPSNPGRKRAMNIK